VAEVCKGEASIWKLFKDADRRYRTEHPIERSLIRASRQSQLACGAWTAGEVICYLENGDYMKSLGDLVTVDQAPKQSEVSLRFHGG
jgi:hypothetical protein